MQQQHSGGQPGKGEGGLPSATQPGVAIAKAVVASRVESGHPSASHSGASPAEAIGKSVSI